MASHGVYFIAIARVSDGVVVAQWVHNKDTANKGQYETTVTNLTTNKTFAARAVPHKRFCLLSSGFSVNFIADDDRFAFVVLTEKSYPERVVFKLIAELQKEFDTYREAASDCSENKLSKKMYDIFADLGNRYDDPAKIDKVAKAKTAVDKASKQLEDNINKMEELHLQTNDLALNAQGLKDETVELQTNAKQYHERMKCRKIKITVAIVAAVVVLLLIIIVPIAATYAR